MLKRMFALLVALLLLPGTVLAEAYKLELSLECSPASAVEAVAMMIDDEQEQQKAAQDLLDLIESIDLQAVVQENGFQFALRLKDVPLLELALSAEESRFFMTSNLWPELCVFSDITDEEAKISEQAEAQLLKTDWESVLDDLSERFVNWLDSAFTGQELGLFMGDAYEGGSRRLTFCFEDSDVAKLLDDCLDVLAAEGIDDDLIANWFGAADLIGGLRDINAEVSEANKYHYVIHLVLDEMQRPVGVSLLTLQDEEQVMSLSLGFGDNGWHAVWGYGLNNENIYIDLVLIDGESGSDRAFSLTVYKDPYREGFRAVEPYLDYMQLLYTGTAGLTPTDSGYAWHADVEAFHAGADTPNQWYRLSGEYQADPMTVVSTFARYISDEPDAEPLDAVHFSLSPCEALSFSADGLTMLDFDHPSFEAELTEAVTEAAGDLMIQLFKTVPASLMVYLMQ